MEGTKTDETKPHCNDLGDLPRFNVHAVCAPKVATGSNEPQKYFGRSDHVEALSQLGPLRSRKGMSQLGIPKMRQTSKFLWHEPASPAVGTYVSKARETATNPRSTGLREALCGLIPGWHEAKHTYGYAYGTESGATRRPRVPFPENGRYVVLASQNYITVRQMRLRWLETSEAHSSPLLKTK